MLNIIAGIAKSRYKFKKTKYIGDIPPRVDIPVIPKSKLQILKEKAIFKYYELTDKIPAVKAKRDLEVAQWEMDFKEYCDKEHLHRKALWAHGIPTTLEDLGVGFDKPYPRPRKMNGWKITGLTIMNNLRRDRDA